MRKIDDVFSPHIFLNVVIDAVSVVENNNTLTLANCLDRYAGSTNHNRQYEYGSPNHRSVAIRMINLSRRGFCGAMLQNDRSLISLFLLL
jgi:hypothetical protein